MNRGNARKLKSPVVKGGFEPSLGGGYPSKAVNMGDTPTYIKNLLMPSAKPRTGRRAWSIDLQQVWIPFFTSTNVMGDTAIPLDALGCPLRLAYDKDGSVKFSKTGRPVIKIAKPVSDCIGLVRENFTANLLAYAHSVATEKAEAYIAQVKLAQKQGEPIHQHDTTELNKAVKLQLEQALREAEVKAQAEAEAEAQAKVEAQAVNPPATNSDKQPSKREAVKV
ncbi:hypothetical protein ES703_118283 [subsurface metagenome]